MDMDRPPRRPRALLLAIATTLLLAVVGVASASAAHSIEGIWSFEDGQIAIQPAANGTFEGIVVVKTTFAECTHEEGEEIWKNITAQPDGSYWGLHQWFTGNCTKNLELGPTAWRILEEPNGSYYLRVCFSHPGTTQPEIAADGAPKGESEYAAYHTTYGCYSSTPTAPLPENPSGNTGSGNGSSSASGSGTAGSGVAGARETLTLPSAKRCLSARFFKIHLAELKYDPFKTVSVTIKGRKIATVRRGKYVVATIDLKGLPKGAFTVKITATTVLKHHLSASRTFHTCIAKIKPKKRGKKG